MLDLTWEIYGISKPTSEHVFAPPRKYRFDYCWIANKVAVEINGGIWIRGFSGRGGSHSLPSNILRDMEKMNLAQKLGWRVFQFTPQQLRKGEAQAFMKQVLAAERP